MICPFCQQPVDRFLSSEDGTTGFRCPACGEDGVPLLYPQEYARHPAVPVSIFGPTGHGKTVFIEALLAHLERRVRWPKFSAQWMDQAGMRASRERLRLLRDHGQLPDATAAVFPRPQVVRLRNVPRVGGCQLLFYDTSGETFADTELLRDRGRYVRNSPVVLWLVSLTELEYPEQLTDLMTVYAEAMAEMGGNPRAQSVVVALTKGDLLIDRPDLPPLARDFLLNDDLDPAGDAWARLEAVSAAIEDWLLGTEHRQIVNLLREQFRAARFCVLSAQGAPARDQVLQMELMPRGVLAPLFWLWREALPAARVGDTPYFSLPDAIAAAPPGGTVRLDAGVYTLADRLEVSGPVAIEGPGPGRCVIRSAAGGCVLSVGPAAGGVFLTGVTVEHTGVAPADVVRVAGGKAVFANCVVAGGVTGPDVPGDGVRAAGSAEVLLGGSVVERNGGNGVTARDAVRVHLADGKVRGNGGVGVFAAGAAAEVQGTELTQNRQSGVYLSGAVRGSVRGCVLKANGANGILAGAEAVADLRGNTCDRNGGHGIALKDRATVGVTGNTCTSNGAVGIAVVDRVTGEVADNRCDKNAVHGIVVEGQSTATVAGNRCGENKKSGVSYAGTAGGVCRANVCTRNAVHGVRVAGAALPTIESTVSRGNGGYGFLVADGAAPTFGRDNVSEGNGTGDYHPERWGRRGWFR
ncbi:MAG: right-handed parallel beta-helix repeat-containing protein [Gemmataceae bacterium]|nr:right-handed parallel beta-helix repeat-containing protein [Gemmataceae bacterium]